MHFIKLIKSSLLNENSLGEPIADNEQTLQNFWNWFEDSKMIDKQGRPKVFYHVTHSKFDTFKPVVWNQRNKRFEVSEDKGRHQYYFTQHKEWVDEFAKKDFNRSQKKNKKIISTYLKISSPFICFDIKEHNLSWWKSYFNKYNINFSDEELDKISRYGKGNVEEFDYSFWEVIFNDTNIVKRKFNEAGFDGIILSDVQKTDKYSASIIVFEPNQIKSISNNINYSKEDNSIYGGLK